MNDLVTHSKNVLYLIDDEYPIQKEYTGVIKEIYELVESIVESAKNEVIIEKKVNFNSLARRFVDETTNYSSPILQELNEVINKLSELQEHKDE
ncbi:hypothetical protein M3E13_04165 [Oceanobacillus kimchii]|uniref:hypothetical protein n=1 Tax=Oceanobacillus kimchii TaxID=746691 RepID=UPI0021A50423|nr:hypothetical protein [Oceanobacillus kimchii]MCT1577036.1 hypothetical protein [Oceanobacillus kimchii]MCT2135106.1 hypothetical protein [Oceanobacillus kimchii]